MSSYVLIIYLNSLASLSIYFLLLSKGRNPQVNTGKEGLTAQQI